MNDLWWPLCKHLSKLAECLPGPQTFQGMWVWVWWKEGFRLPSSRCSQNILRVLLGPGLAPLVPNRFFTADAAWMDYPLNDHITYVPAALHWQTPSDHSQEAWARKHYLSVRDVTASKRVRHWGRNKLRRGSLYLAAVAVMALVMRLCLRRAPRPPHWLLDVCQPKWTGQRRSSADVWRSVQRKRPRCEGSTGQGRAGGVEKWIGSHEGWGVQGDGRDHTCWTQGAGGVRPAHCQVARCWVHRCDDGSGPKVGPFPNDGHTDGRWWNQEANPGLPDSWDSVRSECVPQGWAHTQARGTHVLFFLLKDWIAHYI